jgi:hypothetical protein
MKELILLVIIRNHLQIAWKVSPIPIRLYMDERVFSRVKWKGTQNDNVPSQKTGLACTINQGLG